jgi:ElaB/YqjD/DUF883 family membrane-anchored ribosome-binding protein
MIKDRPIDHPESPMTRYSKTASASVDKLIEDLQAVVTDAEALLKATAGLAGEKVQEVRARAQESLSAAQERLGEMREDAVQQARELVSSGEEYVRRNPWQAVGIAAGAGLLVGLLISLSRR